MNIFRELGDWVYSIAIAAALALVINIFLFQPTKVMGQSMEPTFHEGQRIYLSKVSRLTGKLPAYGDVVVIDSRVLRERQLMDDMTEPVNNVITIAKGGTPANHIWVKRVIGLPGDELEFRGGRVYRNGAALDEAYVKEPMRCSSAGRLKVPAGHIFVLGDNRNNSNDSRFIGAIPVSHILGVMVF